MSERTPTNDIESLRTHLFATLDALRDDRNPMDLARAKAVSEVAQTIINSAKVEVEYLKANSGGESTFLNGTTGKSNLPPGITGVRRHRLEG